MAQLPEANITVTVTESSPPKPPHLWNTAGGRERYDWLRAAVRKWIPAYIEIGAMAYESASDHVRVNLSAGNERYAVIVVPASAVRARDAEAVGRVVCGENDEPEPEEHSAPTFDWLRNILSPFCFSLSCIKYDHAADTARCVSCVGAEFTVPQKYLRNRDTSAVKAAFKHKFDTRREDPANSPTLGTGAGVKSRNHGLPQSSSDVTMVEFTDGNTIAFGENSDNYPDLVPSGEIKLRPGAPTVGTIRCLAGVLCEKHGNQPRATYSNECSLCESERVKLVDSYIRLGLHFHATRGSIIERLERGLNYGVDCTCVVCQLIANAPWPESEAARRVDHWAGVAMQIGRGLSVISGVPERVESLVTMARLLSRLSAPPVKQAKGVGR